ncbi:MAG: glucokinase [Acidobacteria bacterium]|nr:glucokinase [Acidobacteriota bacterium]
MILAGDVGGTKTHLGLFNDSRNLAHPLVLKTFPSGRYPALEDVVREFLRQTVLEGDLRITHACFGVAGPVLGEEVQTPNLPWVIDSKKVAAPLKIAPVLLINDLEATAYGISEIKPESLLCLNRGEPMTGNRAVIAAGTGLGEAFLFWDGKTHRPSACEGGHAEFGPRNDLEAKLLSWLRTRFGHVSYERLLSGPGLSSIFWFLRDTGGDIEPAWLQLQNNEGDPAAEIVAAALAGTHPLAMRALRLFVSIYGAEAGNLALKTLAVGGVYVAGGIAPKIREKLSDGIFMRAFVDKGRFEPLMRAIPVNLILDEKTALAGAARRAFLEQEREN